MTIPSKVHHLAKETLTSSTSTYGKVDEDVVVLCIDGLFNKRFGKGQSPNLHTVLSLNNLTFCK